MDKARKKELQARYKEMKPEMGLLIVGCKDENKCCIEATQDIRGTLNGMRFKLQMGSYPNRELQESWKRLGESSFIIEKLEVLAYDKDESKTDYREDLKLLKELWEDKLMKENSMFYKR